MRLVPLRVGHLDSELRIITGDRGTIAFPIVSWLIEHPDGLVLFDTGMHRELQTDVTRLGRSAEFFRPDFSAGEEVSARLDQRDIRASDIDLMVFSHLHFDHAGGTEEIPDARIVVQEAEWLAGHDEALIEQGIYSPTDYDHGHDVEAVNGQHDLFGDGRLRCIPTPGHTVGHQSLRIELDSGPVVLTGDCIYFEQMLQEMTVPRFGHDLEKQRRSMAELAALRADGCRLLFGHDLAQLERFPAEGLT